MKELKCPKCGSYFQIDDTNYRSIVDQIKDNEFKIQVENRIKELTEIFEKEKKAEFSKIEMNYNSRLEKLKVENDIELNKLKNELQNEKQKMSMDMDNLIHSKDSELGILKNKIEILEREKETNSQILANNYEKKISELNNIIEKNEDKIKISISDEKEKFNKILLDKDTEINILKSKLGILEGQKDTEIKLAISEKDKIIQELNSKLVEKDDKIKIAVIESENKAGELMRNKDIEISKLKGELELKNTELKLSESNLKKTFDEEKKMLQEQINYYKDLKAKMSTKMVGETLEQHCSLEFEKYLRPLLPNAYFDKDNDVIEGTKGDFVFRDREDDFEYVSIMFEMKNEMETTTSKHKNEDFFKKLNEDRNKKKCEFAVLVSLLEADSELYNTGIVNVSHAYPNMYVIRPQFFIPFIMLIVQTARKSLEYKKQLDFIQSKEIDITNFENQLLDFQDKFGRNYRLASDKFKKAIDEIDETIKHLQKVKDAIIGCDNNLRLANDKAEGLTIKKLIRNNPTMKEKFEEARSKFKD